MKSLLLSEIKLRDLTLRNRIVVSPMCQYSSEDGFANDWHFVHLGSRAVGGAGVVFTEAAAVEARGRISPEDLGIWKDEHISELARAVAFIREQGAAAGIQLAHAGRKASTYRPWSPKRGVVPPEDGGWMVVAPSAIPFSDTYPMPVELSVGEIRAIVEAFALAAERSLRAGFQIIEIHAAHGYLLHEFLSPLSNARTDQYGGSLENRARLLVEVVRAIRGVWPESLPLFVRVSSTDWWPGGWDIEDCVALCRMIKGLGVDLIDSSSGGTVPTPKIEMGPGYQTAYAQRIRNEAGVATGAVGLITSPEQAEHILRTGQADLVVLARELLRDPYWPRRAAKALGDEIAAPAQYQRAW
jgi:2,4-dienoyl-CoA reductase-like NADH-dependent reductase (Old Yellow Enzyme family)